MSVSASERELAANHRLGGCLGGKSGCPCPPWWLALKGAAVLWPLPPWWQPTAKAAAAKGPPRPREVPVACAPGRWGPSPVSTRTRRPSHVRATSEPQPRLRHTRHQQRARTAGHRQHSRGAAPRGTRRAAAGPGMMSMKFNISFIRILHHARLAEPERRQPNDDDGRSGKVTTTAAAAKQRRRQQR